MRCSYFQMYENYWILVPTKWPQIKCPQAWPAPDQDKNIPKLLLKWQMLTSKYKTYSFFSWISVCLLLPSWSNNALCLCNVQIIWVRETILVGALCYSTGKCFWIFCYKGCSFFFCIRFLGWHCICFFYSDKIPIHVNTNFN